MPSPQKNQRFPSRLIAVAAVVVVAGAGTWWWTHRDASSGGADGGTGPAGAASAAGGGGAGGRRFAAANRTQPVSVTQAKRQDVRVLLTAIGNISALNTAVVRAKVDGELKAIRFKEGQQVRAGAVLAEIDPRPLEIALAQAQGQMARDQAQMRNAQIDLERYKDLLSKDSIAKQQVDTQDALVRQLAGTVQTDQAQVDNAKLQLSYTKVVAPISGRLGLKQADLGNMVHAGDANGIVTITQTQPISVVFAVPESNLPAINRKLKAGEPLPVEAWDREQKNRIALGKVASTDNAIDPVTGTIKLKAEFGNADGALFPNQFVNIRLQVDTLENALVVPTAAIQRGAQGIYVYAVKDDNSVTVRKVALGTTEGDNVSVRGDLKEGERVVTDGADRLREGAKVEVITAASQAAAAGPEGGQRRKRNGDGSGPGSPGIASSAPAGSASRAAAGRVPGESELTPGDAGQERRGQRPAASGAPGAQVSGASNAAAAKGASWIDQLPPEAQDRARRAMERLPPDVADKVNKMSPDERRDFFQKMREQRRQQSGN